MIDVMIEKEILHIHNIKINTLRKKKYAWLYIILLLSIVVEIEAGKSFYIPVQEHLALPTVLIYSLITSAIATIIELISPSTFDDLTVPLGSTLIIYLLTLI